MTHRVVISRKLAETFADPAVQEELNTSKQKHVEQIFPEGAASPNECTDDEFHWLVRNLTNIYCQGD